MAYFSGNLSSILYYIFDLLGNVPLTVNNMKKAIIITSLFVVCILMALPLTSVAESSNTVDDISKSKCMVVNRLSNLRDIIKERISAYDMPDSGNQNISIFCLFGLFIAFIGLLLKLIGV